MAHNCCSKCCLVLGRDEEDVAHGIYVCYVARLAMRI